MAVAFVEPMDWSGSRDADGHRDYDLEWLVETDDDSDGPEVVGSAVTLVSPPGATWTMGNDDDPWAFCTQELTIRRKQDTEPQEAFRHWTVLQKWTSKPIKRCQSNQVEDPLSEPYRISGGFNKETKERTQDKDGKPLLYTNYERIKGSLVERKTGLPTIAIGINVATLPHATFSGMVERVNSATMWGYPKRCIRLTDIVWSRKLYGTCYYYWTIDYTFEINPETYDIPILNEGRKILKPGGDHLNPADYVMDDEKPTTTLLDANGEPITDITDALYLTPKIDKEANFLLLGIPASI